MAQGSQARRSARPLQIASWCLYDFANSPFTTLVVTFIYSAFFARVIVGEKTTGTVYWSWAINTSAVLVALATPLLGALADRTSSKKRLLALCMFGCVAATAGLAFPGSGQILLAWVLFLMANTLYEVANVFYNSFLPGLGPRERLGRISGYGWALGYLGGLIPLVLALGMVGGLPGQDAPWINPDGQWHVRSTNLLVAGWFLVFAVPLLLFVPEPEGGTGGRKGDRHPRARSRARPGGPPDKVPVPLSSRTARRTSGWTGAFRELVTTFHNVRRYRQAFKFLVARLLYNDGLVTIFVMSALYAQDTLGMPTDRIILLGIWLNVVAGLGALVLGYLDDYLGGKRTILLTLVLLLVGTFVGAAAQSETHFWIAGTVIGLMVGPNQSASRSLMGRFVPAGKEGEFFGFFAFSGKATNWLGVLAFGTITGLTGNQRLAILSVAGLLLAGLVLLLWVDEAEGRRQAQALQNRT